MESLGQSPQGRTIWLAKIAHGAVSPEALQKKPTLLLQAGIHSGEIDGKDATLMFLRDLTKGKNTKLLHDVNLLFIPILNVDGHEWTSPYHRVNQRGPLNMGWRTTAQNLNLNRDYAKLAAPEMRALMKVFRQYHIDLYLDVHVTDGEHYQYDITMGFNQPFTAISPQSATWLKEKYVPHVSQDLEKWGHIPGPLVFGMNKKNFHEGILTCNNA